MKKLLAAFALSSTLLVACTSQEPIQQVDGPLSYTLPDIMRVEHNQVKEPLHLGFAASSNSACFEVENGYSLAEEYAFLADIEEIKSQGEDPKNFSWRVLVFPNSLKKSMVQVEEDFNMCIHGLNWAPFQVSEDYIAVDSLCEGVMLGCSTAQDAMRENIKFLSKGTRPT